MQSLRQSILHILRIVTYFTYVCMCVCMLRMQSLAVIPLKLSAQCPFQTSENGQLL